MTVHIITGTNTDVGKTIVTAALAVRLHTEGRAVTVVKPAQTGEPDGQGDLTTVTRLAGGTVTTVGFARYPEPLAPNLSARRAGLGQLDLVETAAKIRELDSADRTVLVEGSHKQITARGRKKGSPELQVADSPTWVLLSTSGRIARTADR